MKKQNLAFLLGHLIFNKASQFRSLLFVPIFFLFCGFVSAQQRTITGKVVDSNNEDLIGVTVQVKGTTIGVLSGIDGSYSIQIPTENSTLIFSYIGYSTVEIASGNQSVINVTMEEEATMLEEVIVTGYSTERKKDIVGSVTVISTDEMKQINSVSLGNQMQGLASGVIVSGDGSTAGAKIRIRGFGSFGNSDPLYIIDGMPASSSVFNSLNPNDVQSVQVLKDAASASVYGARAANGVVIVTTIQGKVSKKANITFDVYRGINYVSSNDFPDLLNAEEYGKYWYISQTNAGNNPAHAQYIFDAQGNVTIPEYIKAGTYSGATLEGLRVSNPTLFAELVDPANYDFEDHQIVKSADTDWFDEVFNPASVTNMQLNVSGGSESGTYALSMNYYDQDNTANKYAYYKRYTIRANSTYNVSKNIRIGENLQVSYTKSSGSGSSSTAWYMQPLIPVYDIMGNPTGGAAAGLSQAVNPISSAFRNRNDWSGTFSAFGNIFAEVVFLNDFTLRTSYGIDYSGGNSWNVTQKTYENAENTSVSSLSRSMSSSLNWTWTNTLTYNKQIGQNTIKVLLATEAINNYSDNVTAAREDYDLIDDPNFVTLTSGLGVQSNSGSFSRTALSSMFSKLDYSYAEKYLLNATIRRDGSSKFGPNYRYGLFPSVGVGWRISEENFLKDVTWLTDLKLRASWGIIGNQNGLSATNQYTQYVKNNMAGGYAITSGNNVASGYYVSTIGNPDARWEKNITTNVGFDASVFQGKLNVSFEYFKKVTDDLLVTNQAPQTGSNATQPSVNVGMMTNRGIDFSVMNRGEIVKGLTYTASVNFSMYRNVVDRVLDSDDSFLQGASQASMGTITRTEAGKPISYIWTYELDGFFDTQDEVDQYVSEGYSTIFSPAVGRWKVKDQNDDKIINELDKVMTGSPHPDFQVGFNMSLEYRNFDFGGFVFWNQGGEIFNVSRLDVDFNRFTYNRSDRMLNQSWTEGADNSNALLPKIDVSDTETAQQATDYFVEDATYIRLKNLSLGYTLPAALTNKLNIGKLRIYVQAQNLLTIKGGDKPFSGLDPEAALSGTDIAMGVVGSQSPTPKQFVGGINLSF
jgi:TonB-linked SusC/RagA family outer membrane protein